MSYAATLTPRPDIRLIVFDFDGTLSWLRHGWPGMMCEAFEPYYPPRDGETAAQVRETLLSEALALNGQPAIRQCMRFVEMARERGLASPDAETIRLDFQRRLDEAIARRSEKIQRGAVAADSYVVHGARAFLEYAVSTGRTLAILSTTIHERVEAEAELLGIRKYFGRHVYGSSGDGRTFSKRVIFEQMLAEEKVPGSQLLSFGDGPVELRETKELGGLAIGVCSDEVENGSGVCDPHKREGLLAVGADAVVPDYREAKALLAHVLGL